MSKVLKITKPDGTINTGKLNRKDFYERYNKRQKLQNRWKIEEIDESEVKDLPLKDPNWIKPSDMAKALTDKDRRIAELEALLAGSQGPAVNEPGGEPVTEDAGSGNGIIDPSAPLVEGDTRTAAQKRKDTIAANKAKA